MTRPISAYGWFKRALSTRYHYQHGRHALCGLPTYARDEASIDYKHTDDHPDNCNLCKSLMLRVIKKRGRGVK